VAVTTTETLGFFPEKGVVTGYPVRAEFYELKQEEARAALGLDPDALTVIVFGGSQGARSINMTVINVLPELLRRAQVIHVTGRADAETVRNARSQLPQALQERYHVHEYLDEMPKALVAADLAICRAGASTLGELPAAGLPAILVPYPYAGAHQRLNAEYLARYNAAVVIEDRDLGMGLLPILTKLLDDPERLARMKVEAQKLARPGAAAKIVRELWQIMDKGGKGAEH
jgi:UDP-N-acetylglucosamine--N-acetylmuramyl-(pentapeptide) pyrophosphoryl-undecaprenol N-acetylglucosamine transferase